MQELFLSNLLLCVITGIRELGSLSYQVLSMREVHPLQRGWILHFAYGRSLSPPSGTAQKMHVVCVHDSVQH